jgi:hypothetical protein
MKKFYLILFCLSFATLLIAQNALQIMQTSRDKTKLSGLEAISTLTIRDSKDRIRVRKTAMVSKTYPDQVEKRIIRFIEPADVKGMGMLIIDKEFEDDDIWIYLPANRQSRRIVSSEKSKSFMGSEFSNADMSAPNLNDFSFQLLGEEKIDEMLCWKIELRPMTPAKEDEYGFMRKISWINKADHILLRSDYYDFDNEKYKTLSVLNYREMDLINHKFIITHMTIQNHKNDRSSDMEMEQVIYNPKVSDKYFNVSYLEKP